MGQLRRRTGRLAVLMAAAALVSLGLGHAAGRSARSSKKARAAKPSIVTIGDPRDETAVAGLSLGNTVEYARKLWGPEAERAGQGSKATSYTWYLRKNVYLFVNTDDLGTARSILLNNQDHRIGVRTAGRVILGRDTLSDLERKLGSDYKIGKGSGWGAEETYIAEVVYYTGPEASLALTYGFDLTAPNRASPPKGYEQWLARVEAALDSGNRREAKRLLGKRPAYYVELT